MADAMIEAIRAGKLGAVRAAVKADPEAARHPKYMVEAGRLGSLSVIQLLHRNGSDVNASYKKYSALSNLIQENPHAAADGKADPPRLACLTWLLENGDDPEQLSAWPPARTAAALGDISMVEKALRADPDFVHARDHGGGEVRRQESGVPEFRARDHGVLTALQCAAGSRLPGAKTLAAAALLFAADADVAAETPSWGHPVDAVYFAASSKNLPMFDLLLKRGANASHALGPALWNATLSFAALASERGGRPDRAVHEKKPLLNNLTCRGRIPQTMWLLAHYASPNIADMENGWTAVHQAVSRSNARIMRAVLDAGGDLGRRDKQGRTPVDVARSMGRGTLLASMAAAAH